MTFEATNRRRLSRATAEIIDLKNTNGYTVQQYLMQPGGEPRLLLTSLRGSLSEQIN